MSENKKTARTDLGMQEGDFVTLKHIEALRAAGADEENLRLLSSHGEVISYSPAPGIFIPVTTDEVIPEYEGKELDEQRRSINLGDYEPYCRNGNHRFRYAPPGLNYYVYENRVFYKWFCGAWEYKTRKATWYEKWLDPNYNYTTVKVTWRCCGYRFYKRQRWDWNGRAKYSINKFPRYNCWS